MIQRKKKKCQFCGRSRFIKGRGLCSFCYAKDYASRAKKRNYYKKKKRKSATPTEKQKKIRALDRDFSLLVRALYAKNGEVECYTCGHRMPWKGGGAQNGHFQGRGKMCLRWDLRNCRVQDANCNVGLSGNLEVFEQRLREEKGDRHVDELIREGNKTCRYTLNDLLKMHDQVKARLNKVLKEKSL